MVTKDLTHPDVFAVVSWGCAATSWLAKVLNSHPDILSMHGGRYYINRTMGGSTEDLAYVEALLGLGRDYVLVGDVHNISQATVPLLVERYGAQFNAACLVREPIVRLHSVFAHYIYHKYDGWGDLSYLAPTAGKAGFDWDSLSVEQQHHLHGINCLNNIVSEVKLAPCYRQEDLTRDPAVLVDLITLLSGGKISVDEDWARRAIAIPAVNQHVVGKLRRPLTEWEMQACRTVVWPEAWKAYRRLGYELPDWLGLDLTEGDETETASSVQA